MRHLKTRFKKEFAKLMEQTSIPSNLSNEEIVKHYAELFSFIEPNIPNKLFRFRKCSLDNIISFEQNTIPVCTASMFSDKHDSTVYYNHKAFGEKAKGAYNQFMPNILKLLRSNPSAFPTNQLTLKALEHIKSLKSEKEILDSLWHEFEPMFKEMERRVIMQKLWPRNNKTTKIACFTETVKSKFMWDAYADGYTGFALEYDFTRWRALTANNHAVILCPIVYTSQKMDATEMIEKLTVQEFMFMGNSQVPDPVKQLFISSCPIDRLYFQKIYLYKDKTEYSHEKEWRLLDIVPTTDSEVQSDFSSIPDAGCLKAIYYGSEMEPRYKAHLRNIAKQKGLREYDVILDTQSRKYNLKLTKL